MKACIIGLGETGESIAFLLIQDPRIKSIQILDPKPETFGKFLDLSHAAVSKNKEIQLNNFENTTDVDVFFYCAGFRNTKQADRSTKAKENKELIKTIFSQLSLKPEALIITISNPVELMSEWIYHHFKGEFLVVGTGTELDTNRLRSITAYRLNISAEDVHIPVIGEHGSAMVPLYSKGLIQGKSVHDFFNSNELNFLTDELVHMASKIRQTQDATKFGVAQSAFNIWQAFQSEKEEIHNVSTLIPTEIKNEFEIEQDIFISYPVKISSNGIEAVKDLILNKEEKTLFKKAVNKIKNLDMTLS